MQKGFVPLIPLVLGIIAGLVLTFSFGSSDLIIASISDAKLLMIPNDIGYSLEAYGNKDYKDSLSDAWDNALKARQTADEWHLAITLNKGKLNFEWSFQSRLSEFFTSAVKASIDTYSGMSKMLLEDLNELDKIGADKIVSAKAHKVYLDIKEVLENVEFDNYTRDSCSEDKVISKVECLTLKLSQLKDKKNALLASQIFNLIVGDKGLLYDYFSLHKDSEEAIPEMKDDYESKKIDFDDKFDALSEDISMLKDEKVDLMTQDVVNSIDFKEDKLVSGKAGSPSDKIYAISRSLRALDIERQRAESIYKSKDEDYVYSATEKIDGQRLILSELLSQVDSLKVDLAYIEKSVKDSYLELSSNKDLSNSFYVEAVKIGEATKKEKTLGERIVGYLEAIKYLKLAKEGNKEPDFSYVDGVLDSLTKYGFDVSSEKSTVEKLKTIKQPELSSDVTITLDAIKEKLNQETASLQNKILDLKEKASYYLEALNDFKRDPDVSKFVDDSKLTELELKFDKANKKDVLSNIDFLADTYNGLIKEASAIIRPASSAYLKDFVVVSQSFSKDLNCQESTDTELLVLVKNPLRVQLNDIKISYNLQFLFKQDGSGNFSDVIELLIPLIEPGKTYDKTLDGLSKLKECPDNLTVELLQPESTTAQDLNRTEELIKLGNQLEDLCYFTNCTELRKMYSSLKKDSSDFGPFINKLDEGAGKILLMFNGTAERIEKLKQQQGYFETAVDSNVGFEVDNSFLVHSENDSQYVSDEFVRLSKIGKLFDTVSLQSEKPMDVLESYLGKFSKEDLKKFNSDVESLESYISSTISYLKSEAKSKLSRTGSEYEASKNIDMYDYLGKATDSFENNYYTRSILYSDKAHEISKAGGDNFPFEYLILGGILSGFILYISKKPKNKKRIERRVLRRFED